MKSNQREMFGHTPKDLKPRRPRWGWSLGDDSKMFCSKCKKRMKLEPLDAKLDMTPIEDENRIVAHLLCECGNIVIVFKREIKSRLPLW